MVITGGTLLTSAIVAGAGIVAAQDASRKQLNAVKDARAIAAATEYQPIDIEQLKTNAHDQAVKNATDSLALERQLQPDVARTRELLNKTTADQLALRGALPPDVANMVTQAARVSGGNSGTISANAPLTAQRLGVSALGLMNQRQDNAANLLSLNPLPTAGLDPGTLASLEVQQNAAQNQFNLAKAGVNTNLVNSQAQANTAATGANAASYAAILNLLTKNNGGTGGIDSGSVIGKLATAYGNGGNPATNPISYGGSYNLDS